MGQGGPEREGPAQSHTASQRQPGHTGGQNAALGDGMPQKGWAGPHGCCLCTCFLWAGGSVCERAHAAPRLSPDFQLSSSTANCPLPAPP